MQRGKVKASASSLTDLTTLGVIKIIGHTRREYLGRRQRPRKEEPQGNNAGDKAMPAQETTMPREIEGHVRNMLLATKFAKLNRPVTRAEIQRELNIASRNVDNFISACKHIQWLQIDTSRHGYLFTVDDELKNICEGGRRDSRLGGQSRFEFVLGLLLEVFGQVEYAAQEAMERRIKHNLLAKQRNWNPDALNKMMLLEVIDSTAEQHRLILAKQNQLESMSTEVTKLQLRLSQDDSVNHQRPN